MNKHIELVKKWLENKDSVFLEELEANAKAAAAAYDAANAAYDAANAVDDAAYVAAMAAAAANAVDDAAFGAAMAAAANAADDAAFGAAMAAAAYYDYAPDADAAYWIKRFEELTK